MVQDGSLTPQEEMTGEILALYRSDPAGAETAVETYIERRFEGYPAQERLGLLQELIRYFEEILSRAVTAPMPEQPPSPKPETDELATLLSMLFGEKISTADLHSPERMEKLAASLNTIFDMLNQIIAVIHATLLGEKQDTGGEETIRQIIGFSLKEGGDSVQGYLDQIRDAFLTAHHAFQESALIQMEYVFKELDPANLGEGEGTGLKFGPFRKAELFDIYLDRYRRCESWFRSGRFREDLLREFERHCQQQYQKK